MVCLEMNKNNLGISKAKQEQLCACLEQSEAMQSKAMAGASNEKHTSKILCRASDVTGKGKAKKIKAKQCTVKQSNAKKMQRHP